MRTIEVKSSCIVCGRCVAVCPATIFRKTEESTILTQHIGACIVCGHCVAVCPTDAIEHSDFPVQTVHAGQPHMMPSPESVLELMRMRRSTRVFLDKPIPEASLAMILEAAYRAPSATNQQALQYTLITTPSVLEGVTRQCMDVIAGNLKKMKNPLVHFILKRAMPEVAKLIPSLEGLLKHYANGEDKILRGGKALLLIHGSQKRFGEADANLAYQNASIMAESLGVGQFYGGFVCAFSSKQSDKRGIIKEYMGINNELYAAMILGMPKVKYRKYIDRKPQVVAKK